MWSKNKPLLGAKQNWKHPLSIGLVAHYLFNEGGGNTAINLIDKKLNGTLVNNPSWATGKFGKAISFNGTSQYAASTWGLLGSGMSRTVTFWFKTNTLGLAGNNPIVSTGNILSENSPLWLIVQRPTTNVLSVDHGGAYRDGTTVLATNKWYFGAYTFNSSGNAFTLYLNSNVESSGTSVDSGVNTNLYIGEGYPGYFSGSIDDVRIYNRALSASEVKQLYTNPFADVRPSRNSWSLSNLLGGTPFSPRAPYMTGVLSIKA